MKKNVQLLRGVVIVTKLKNIAKAKACEDGNKLETCTCKFKKASLDPQKNKLPVSAVSAQKENRFSLSFYS